jgi:hypothetical protein
MFQFLLTQPVMDGLQQGGEKIDIKEMVKMTFDVTGWPNRQSLIVPLDQQDQQRIQAQSEQAQQQAQMQHAQQMEQIKTNSKSQLLDQATASKAGQLVIRKALMDDDRAGFGLK